MYPSHTWEAHQLVLVAWSLLGLSWDSLTLSWPLLGFSLALLNTLMLSLGPLPGSPEHFWLPLGLSMASLGLSWAALGGLLASLTLLLGSLFGPRGPRGHKRATKCHKGGPRDQKRCKKKHKNVIFVSFSRSIFGPPSGHTLGAFLGCPPPPKTNISLGTSFKNAASPK